MNDDNTISTVGQSEALPKEKETITNALDQAIADYLQWMVENGYKKSTRKSYECELRQFKSFIKKRKCFWKEIFTQQMLQQFKQSDKKFSICCIRGLWRYLFDCGKVAQPIPISKPLAPLPDIYEDYLVYQKKYHNISDRNVKCIRNVLCEFDDYCQRSTIQLRSLKIEHVDVFLSSFLKNFTVKTCRLYRGYLRQFLSYLYNERRVLKKDLAPMVVGRREYAQAKPPKFLRPAQVQQLFDSLKPCSASGIRTYAIVHLAYTMGLRPKEISQLRLDDISFTHQLLRLTVRKGDNPFELPVPEHTIKAIAAYIIGARPKTKHRRLFLTLYAPYRPMQPNTVAATINDAMKNAGLNAGAYWMRRTYAQNLLEAGASIFEIKEMLGHDKIESTKIYLHVHTKLMRQVLFDETL